MRRVVLITGVAGKIGDATAAVFSKEGWIVIGIDRDSVEDQKNLDHFIQIDISIKDTPQRVIEEVRKREKRLDALVNNAAIQICKPLINTTLNDWDETISSNVRAPFLLVVAAYPLLKESAGSVVNVSSVHAVATSVGIAAYATSKGALLAMTRAMALELAQDHIRINAVLPGAIDTRMLRDGLMRGHAEGQGVDELLAGLGRKHVIGRVGKPKEIGEAILFLADGERSSFITGQSLIVDGGATARLSTE